jgi:peroxiredoxin
MALTYSTPTPLGSSAPDFLLPGVDGKNYSLASFKDARALVVIFMCNHCPYVIAVQERINQLAKDYASKGVKLIGISSNDVETYPEDSFEKMKQLSKERGFVFPYVIDETQEVARAYDAACTPDPYVYENQGGKFVLPNRRQLERSESRYSSRISGIPGCDFVGPSGGIRSKTFDGLQHQMEKASLSGCVIEVPIQLPRSNLIGDSLFEKLQCFMGC